MNNILNRMLGVAIFLFAFSIFQTNNVQAQTTACVRPPSCSELGYNYTATDCQGYARLVCPFDNTMFYCAPTPVAVGDFLYTDMTSSPMIIPSKTVMGIVIDSPNRIALSINQINITGGWGATIDIPELTNYTNVTDAKTDMNGFENTKKIITYGENHSFTFPAAEAAYTYSPGNSNTSKKWFIPALGQMASFIKQNTVFQKAVKAVSGTALTPGLGMSSTEASASNSYVYYGEALSFLKTNNYIIVPAINF